MTKYIVSRHSDGPIAFVRVCHTEKQLEEYTKLYTEEGLEFTIESENPILVKLAKTLTKGKRCPLCGQEIR